MALTSFLRKAAYAAVPIDCVHKVWVFDSSREKWEKLCDGGPAPAGHVAAVDYDAHRLVLCFGVRRQAPHA